MLKVSKGIYLYIYINTFYATALCRRCIEGKDVEVNKIFISFYELNEHQMQTKFWNLFMPFNDVMNFNEH